MADIFQRNHRCYGYRRMRASLSSQCVHICEKVVLRLMNQERLVAAAPKRRRYGSYLGEISPAPENLINRIAVPTIDGRDGWHVSRMPS
jgi:putative transposase